MRRLKKSAFFKRLVSFLLALAVMGPVAGTLAVPAKAAGLSLAELQAKYPDGSVWNGSFDGSRQCAGFARLMCYEAYGSEFYINNDGRWKKYTAVSYIDNGLKAGDLVRYKNNGIDHSVFITGVFGDQVSFGDCNANGTRNGVRWDTMKRSLLKNGFHHAYSAPYDFVAQGSPAPTPPPAPVTPELTLSASSISLKVGQSVTIQATTKSAETIYLDFQSLNGSLYSVSRGRWNSSGTQQPLTITGITAGTTDLTVVMRKADTGAALASKNIPVTVAPSGTPKITFSPSAVTMNVGDSVAVTADIAWNGAWNFRWKASDYSICSGKSERKSDTRQILTFTGKKAGTMIQYATFLDVNGKELGTYSLPITVKAPEPDFVRAGKSAVEINVGEKVSIPVTYGIHSASSIHFTHKAENASVCRSTVPSTSQNAATVDVYGLAPGKTKVTIAIYKTPGETLLASTSVDVTVRQKETPPAIKVAPDTLSLGVGETKNLDLAWSGSVPSGAEIQIIATPSDIASAKMLSVNPNGSARVAVTGRKEGTSHLNLVLCDGNGNALCSTPATVNVAAPAEKTTIRADTDQTIFLGEDEVRIVSFAFTGTYSGELRSHDSALTVKDLGRTNGQLLYAVSTDQPGSHYLSVSLVDSRGNVLDSAEYRFEAVFASASETPPSDTITVSGTVPEEKPGDGGSSVSDSRVYPTDGNWISKIDPEESSGGGTYVVTGTRVSSSASGEVILVIPLDGKANVTTQSAGKPAVTIPTDLASSGSVEIKLSGNETLPAQSGETAGDSTLSGTVSAVLNEDGSPEAGREIVASDGTVVSGGSAGTGLRFTDVSSGKYYYDAVRWAVSSGVTDGISGTTLAPDNSCPRGQVVEFMWRAMGCPEPAVKENPFTDVSAADSYYQAALWAYGAGVTTGSTATTFSPGSTCTRGQVVTFLWRANGQPRVSGTNAFSDVSAGAYFADSVRWAVDQGITKGTTDTTFSPGNTCTRGQILTFLYRGMA